MRQLHKEFLRAGADVMQAFTFNGTEESIVSRGVSIKVFFKPRVLKTEENKECRPEITGSVSPDS